MLELKRYKPVEYTCILNGRMVIEVVACTEHQAEEEQCCFRSGRG